MKVDVLIEINGQSLIVGELNETETRGHRTTSFTFSDEWLSNPDAFEFDPNLTKFSVLISNVDDHFRNHGFLWVHQKGWRLSPLYDVNPVYNSSGTLRTNIDYDNSTASVTLLLEVAKYFAFDTASAKSEIKRICDIVLQWETYAKTRKAPRSEIELMRRAFEHSETEMAKYF